MLASDVDMFGAPCDRARLAEFFAAYPEIAWEVTSKYVPRSNGSRAVTFAYTRTWTGGPGGERLAIQAEEAITFNR
jgi:hypothetical protein